MDGPKVELPWHLCPILKGDHKHLGSKDLHCVIALPTSEGHIRLHHHSAGRQWLPPRCARLCVSRITAAVGLVPRLCLTWLFLLHRRIQGPVGRGLLQSRLARSRVWMLKVTSASGA